MEITFRGIHSSEGTQTNGETARYVLSECLQALLFGVAASSALALRLDFRLSPAIIAALWQILSILVPVKAIVFHLCDSNRKWWRFTSLHDAQRLIFTNLAASLIAFPCFTSLAPARVPVSLPFIDLLTCFLLTAGLRVATRVVAENRGTQTSAASKRTLIYGAGVAGQMLIRELRANNQLPYEIFGLIDDDPSKKNTRVQGIRVLGAGADLADIVSNHQIEMVLVAIPSASSPTLATLFRHCRQAGAECKTVPGLSKLVEGRALTSQVRDVALDDLLGRKPVRLDQEQLRLLLEGKVALVTGAAGSIGSELCRQIAKFNPQAIIGYEIAESALFHLDAELKAKYPAVTFVPIVGSIQNSARLFEVFQTHRPSLVFHAAAYKHVPMMEVHPFEAIENNVFGTYNVARIAKKMGVERFVLISSDKAVRPTNIMGTTKRIAELIVQSMHSPGTKFVAVRFGNVLGSNGSVVPIFKEQIAKGGPVLVTHPEMTRYFMTIPEAAQLVLQGSSMAEGRETFVLDMGEPVRIVDLARNLILLSGLQPGSDIEIKFCGMRPGEKLYEELCTDEENTVDTPHEKIRVFRGPEVDPSFVKCLENLERHCLTRNLSALVAEMRALVPEYSPSAQVLETQQEQNNRTSLLKLAEAVRSTGNRALASPVLS